MQKVPFNDLLTQHTHLKEELDFVIEDVINNSLFVRGKYVEKFELEFARKVKSKFCISCGNGTDAILIALKALKLKPGDEVIVPAHTWISTSETVTLAGGKVVFCDTEKDTFTIDPESISNKITDKTVGIIAVHLFGQAADMEKICDIANKKKLWIIEDCAQAHLSQYKDNLVGSFGNIATYSFYPGKNLGALGDGGAITTNDEKLAEYMTMFARHGGVKKGIHLIEGMNSRLDGLQAAFLNVKLKYLEDWTSKRRGKAENYNSKLKNLKGIELPFVRESCAPVWHLYVIRCEKRDLLKDYLKDEGISTIINYPTALPFLPAYQYLNHKFDDFPNSYSNQRKILSLPIFPDITDDQISYVSNKVSNFTKNF